MKLLAALALSLVFPSACDSPGSDMSACRTTERMVCEMNFACDASVADTISGCMEMLGEEGEGEGLFCQYGDEVDFSECQSMLAASKIECAKPEDEREHWSRILGPTVEACLTQLETQR